MPTLPSEAKVSAEWKRTSSAPLLNQTRVDLLMLLSVLANLEYHIYILIKIDSTIVLARINAARIVRKVIVPVITVGLVMINTILQHFSCLKLCLNYLPKKICLP